MRRKINFNKLNRLVIILIFISVLSYFIINLCSYNCSAQEEKIAIMLTDTNDLLINQITEGNLFKIMVYNPDLETNSSLANVLIKFNDSNYQITNETENQEIVIPAPMVNEDKDFTIKAIKGDLITQTNITVKNKVTNLDKPNLVIDPCDWIVEADSDFYVTVTDDTSEENPVSGVTVYIVNEYDQRYTTETNGKAYLHSPEDEEEITIFATKEGYKTGSIKLRVNTPDPLVEKIIQNKYFAIFIAVIILVFVVTYVHFRQNKSIYKRTNEIAKEKKMEKYGLKENSDIPNNKYGSERKSSSINDVIRVNSTPESKVEEIRISKPRKEKEVVPIKTEEEKAEKIISDKKNKINDSDWFKGKDDVKYEIDKLTGEIDEEGLDKWFEGVDTLKEKINEKVKKDKKKDKEE